MGNVNESYSVFLSTTPYGTSPMSFIYLCSDATIDYSLNYSGTTTGVLGQGTDMAIFVDGAAGAVGNISISGVRANPNTSITSKIITPSGELQNSLISNAQLWVVAKNMLKENQMFQGAYVLRVYNMDWSKINTNDPTAVQAFNDSYKELYVHISKFKVSFDWTGTSDAQVSLTCFRRYKNKGFGEA